MQYKVSGMKYCIAVVHWLYDCFATIPEAHVDSSIYHTWCDLRLWDWLETPLSVDEYIPTAVPAAVLLALLSLLAFNLRGASISYVLKRH